MAEQVEFVERIHIGDEDISFVRLLQGNLLFMVDTKNKISMLDMNARKSVDLLCRKTTHIDFRFLREAIRYDNKILLYFHDVRDKHVARFMFLNLSSSRPLMTFVPTERIGRCLDSVYVAGGKFIMKAGDKLYQIEYPADINEIEGVGSEEYSNSYDYNHSFKSITPGFDMKDISSIHVYKDRVFTGNEGYVDVWKILYPDRRVEDSKKEIEEKLQRLNLKYVKYRKTKKAYQDPWVFRVNVGDKYRIITQSSLRSYNEELGK